MPSMAARGVPARSRLVLTIALAAALSGLLPEPPKAGVNAATVLAVFFVPVFFVVVRRLFTGKPAAAPASDVETAHD